MTSEQRDFLRKQIDAQVRERVERARSARAQASAEAQAMAEARTHEAGSVTSPVVRNAPERPRLAPPVSPEARAEMNRYVRALRAGKDNPLPVSWQARTSRLSPAPASPRPR